MDDNFDYLTFTEEQEVARLTKVIRSADKKAKDYALRTAAVPDIGRFMSDYVEIKILSDIAGSHKAIWDQMQKTKNPEAPKVREALNMVRKTLMDTIFNLRNHLRPEYPKPNFDTLMTLVGYVSHSLEERAYFKTVQFQKENN